MDQRTMCAPIDGYRPEGGPGVAVALLEWADARRLALRAPCYPVLDIFDGPHRMEPGFYTFKDGEIVLRCPPAFTLAAVVALGRGGDQQATGMLNGVALGADDEVVRGPGRARELAGRELLHRLRCTTLRFLWVGWVKGEAPDDWRFLIVNPCVEMKGAGWVYARLFEAIGQEGLPKGIDVADILVAPRLIGLDQLAEIRRGEDLLLSDGA